MGGIKELFGPFEFATWGYAPMLSGCLPTGFSVTHTTIYRALVLPRIRHRQFLAHEPTWRRSVSTKIKVANIPCSKTFPSGIVDLGDTSPMATPVLTGAINHVVPVGTNKGIVSSSTNCRRPLTTTLDSSADVLDGLSAIMAAPFIQRTLLSQPLLFQPR
jgi:hypothetical protein